MDDSAELVEALSRQIQPLLYRKGPLLVGAVLIDLVSLWIAGHVAIDPEGDALRTLDETRKLRQTLLSDFIIAVEGLIPASAEEIGAPHDGIVVPTHNPFKRN